MNTNENNAVEALLHEIHNLKRVSMTKEEEEFRKLYEWKIFTHFPLVKCGNFYLSIQAGEGYYCFPRRDNFDCLSEYERVEVAIFEGELQKWVLPKKDVRFQSFGWIDRFELGKDTSVGGGIDWETLKQVIIDLLSIS